MCACIDCLPACVHALADKVNKGRYHEPELGTEYCEQEP
jgi:hypothetical protein